MRRTALPALAIALLALSACSEERSDIENLDTKALEEDARALSESADTATQGQVEQIQPMAIEGVQGDAEKTTPTE